MTVNMHAEGIALPLSEKVSIHQEIGAELKNEARARIDVLMDELIPLARFVRGFGCWTPAVEALVPSGLRED